jgi:hypothetical protein
MGYVWAQVMPSSRDDAKSVAHFRLQTAICHLGTASVSPTVWLMLYMRLSFV